MIEFIEANLAWFIIGLILFDIYLLFDIAIYTDRATARLGMAAGQYIEDLKSEVEELKSRIDDIQDKINDDF